MPYIKTFWYFLIIKTFKTFQSYSVCVQKSEPVAANKSWLFIFNSSFTSHDPYDCNQSLSATCKRPLKPRTHIRDLSQYIVASGRGHLRHALDHQGPLPWSPRCGVLRRAHTDAPTGARDWLHGDVIVELAPRAVARAHKYACRHHAKLAHVRKTILQRRSNVLISWEIMR